MLSVRLQGPPKQWPPQTAQLRRIGPFCPLAEVEFDLVFFRPARYARPMVADGDRTQKRLEIKKYPNRRYYDATHSRHLTLDEIRSLVQEGYDLRVIDARTGADITAQVLTQIILELDTPKLDSLPVPLLLRLIRMNDQLVKDFIEKYFNQALQSFLEYQRQLEEQIRRTHGLPPSFPSVSAWTQAVLQPFASAFSGQYDGPSAPARGAAEETARLKEMIDELQKQVRTLKKARGRKGATRGRSRA